MADNVQIVALKRLAQCSLGLALYQVVGSFDAVAVGAGEVVFAPLSQLTAENWQFSLGSKLMGQISLVQEAIRIPPSPPLYF